MFGVLTAAVAARGEQSQSDSTHPADSSAAAQTQPDRVRVSGTVTAGMLIHRVPPIYPKKARKKRIQGMVVMQATITKTGDIAEIRLISGEPSLAEAAMDAVKQWRYRPYLVDGRAVEVETEIRINFTLAGS